MTTLSTLLNKSSVVGVVGNRSTGKTSLCLSLLLDLRKKYPKVKIAVMGIEPCLNSLMKYHKIKVLYSKMDILDLRMRDTVIYISEMALFFDSRNKNKQLTKLMRFFDRIEHNNCKLIMDTAREGYYNKFFCSRVNAFLVKQIEYDALVNGTWLKERVTSITSISDYRLEIGIPTYFIVSNDGEPTKEKTFEYDPRVDTKKENVRLFK